LAVRGGRGNGAPRFGGAHVRYEPELFGRGRIVHVQGAAVVGGRPAAVNEAKLAQQQRIFEFHNYLAQVSVKEDSAFIDIVNAREWP
jgi:hypothetical protein